MQKKNISGKELAKYLRNVKMVKTER